jgi:chaperonin GroES|tara:strand:+ start:1619 stop:1879 length:261 start_codon:yes stop_codon:yes gene_type:complete
MKAVGRNLIIKKVKEGTTKTKGGLLLAETHRDDIRYVEASVVSSGEEIKGIKEGSKIFFDRHAGHKIEIEKQTYHVIKVQDVVVVL